MTQPFAVTRQPRASWPSRVRVALPLALAVKSSPLRPKCLQRALGQGINAPELASIKLRGGMLVIGDSLHRQRYKFLWDVLLDNHPHGVFILLFRTTFLALERCVSTHFVVRANIFLFEAT